MSRFLVNAKWAAPAVLLAGLAQAEEPPRWEFSVGQDLRYRVVQTQEMTVNAGSSDERKTVTVATTDLVWKVEAVEPNGSARVREVLERLQLKVTGPGAQNYTLDTDSEQPPEGLATLLDPLYQAMVDANYLLTITPEGVVKDIVIPQEVQDALERSNLSLVTPVEYGSVRTMSEDVAVPLPSATQWADREWRSVATTGVPVFGSQTVETTYKAREPREVGGSTMEVFEPSVRVTIRQGEYQADSMRTAITSNASSGEVLFDRAAGRLHASEVSCTLEMEVEPTGGSGGVTKGVVKRRTTIQYGKKSPPADDSAAVVSPAE